MSRLARAVEILEAFNEFFREGGDQAVLYPGSQILESEVGIADAIADCLGVEDLCQETVPAIARSQRRSYGYNRFKHVWVGFLGQRRIREFVTLEEAVKWQNEG